MIKDGIVAGATGEPDWRGGWVAGIGLAADGPGSGGAFEHGFGDKVVGERPRLARGGVEAVAKDGPERGEEGVAEGLVVGRPDSIANVPGSQGAGVGEQFVEAGH